MVLISYRHRRVLELLWAASLAATAYLLPSICAAQEAEPVTVTECGTTVEAGHTAYLLNDIDCRGRGTEGIVLSDRSRLVLAGHVILGDPTETARDGRVLQGVRCKTGSLCAVQGPGAVLGFSASGIAGTRVRVRDVYIADNAVAGISAFENVRVRNVALAANGGLGIHAGGRVSGVGTDADAQPGTPVLQWRSPSRLRDRCATAPSGS